MNHVSAPKGNRNAWKHGRYSREATAERRQTRELIRSVRELLDALDDE